MKKIYPYISIVILLGAIWNCAGAATCYYDTQNRLTRIEYSSTLSIAYTYDRVGNRTSQIINGNPQAGADLNLDSVVNFKDFVLLASNWYEFCSMPDWCGNTDINRNGYIGLDDLTIFASHWLEGTVVNTNYVFDIKWGSYGSADGQFQYPYGIDIALNGNIYVVDHYNDRVQVFSPTGTFIKKIENTNFSRPTGIAIDNLGIFYVTSANTKKIIKFGQNGSSLSTWDMSSYPSDLATDSSGNVYVALPQAVDNKIIKINSTDGSVICSTSGGPGLPFNWPGFVSVDSNNRVYVSDQVNKRIQVFDNNLTYITCWSVGVNTSNPGKMAFDSQGNAFLCDITGGTFQKYSSNGIMLKKWGSSPYPFNQPIGITIDSNNKIYISDHLNSRVQKFIPAP